MTKKDYVLIASVMRNTTGFFSDINEYADMLIKNLADELEAENPLFNRVKFLVECGFAKCAKCYQLKPAGHIH